MLDFTDSILNQLSYDNDVVILGDYNTDLGPFGGPLSTSTLNKQGRILFHHLNKWNYASIHPHTCSRPYSHTYHSEVQDSYSTTGHILSPVHLHVLSNCFIAEEDPLNMSDYSPVFISLPPASPHPKSRMVSHLNLTVQGT